ncbi:uncharacterized protein BJ171DRAFT_627408 [Polychytrium aggregatum]|uniref:uncharacterized protein n=1 Tax=Polychytrium aggregatum TaxID=110093 RepID=UPI0022FF15FF|nr:uncharacterized protein BJ171DRAFT_627408 [Polychytrium aggregatum]KAI9202537.1 hypothetical protein BJ171DRAFT_627408 [Polychytrium aggregatum]
MDVFGTKILAGSLKGGVHLFDMDNNELASYGKGLSHSAEFSIGKSSLKNVSIAPPGNMVRTIKIGRVKFAPNASKEYIQNPSPSHFLATQGKIAFIWDMEQNTVTARETFAKDHLLSVDWSPHPFGQSLIAAGSVDRSVSLLDQRQMGLGGVKSSVVWSVARAHNGVVSCTQFNPFVPYWLATAGDDAVVRLWDIRYSKYPAGKLEGSYSAIDSMCWSNTHCDVVSVGCRDGAWRAWSFTASVTVPRETSGTSFIGLPSSDGSMSTTIKTLIRESVTKAKDDQGCATVVGGTMIGEFVDNATRAPIVSCIPSASHPDTYYSLSGTGDVIMTTLRGELFAATTPHRYDAQRQSGEYEIECFVNNRDLVSALNGILQLSKSCRFEGRLTSTYEGQLIELLTARPPVSPDSWTVAPNALDSEHRLSTGQKIGGNEMVGKLRNDLQQWTYFLPPNFEAMTQWWGLIPVKLRKSFELETLRFNSLRSVERGSWEQALQAEKAICDGMQADSTYMDVESLQSLVECVLQNDFCKGIAMGIKFTEIYEDDPARHLQDLADLYNIMLFPTVHDQGRWMPPVTALAGEDALLTTAGQKPRQTIIAEYHEAKRQGEIEFVPIRPYRAGPSRERSESVTSVMQGGSVGSQTPFLDTKLAKLGTPTLRTSISVAGPSTPTSMTINNLASLAEEPKLGLNGKVSIQVSPPTDTNSRRRAMIETTVTNPKNVIPMLKLEALVMKLLANPTRSVEEDIVRLFTPVGSDTTGGRDGLGHLVVNREKTISAYSSRIYLDCLVATKRFEEYFIVFFEMNTNYPQTDFIKTVLKHAERVALVRLKRHSEGQILSCITKVLEGGAKSTLGELALEFAKRTRELLVVQLRIGCYFAQAGENKSQWDREGLEALQRMAQTMCAILSNTGANVLTSLEHIEKYIGKSPASPALREAAQAAVEIIREVYLKFPKRDKRDPVVGGVIIEEVSSLQERLGKILKAEGASERS